VADDTVFALAEVTAKFSAFLGCSFPLPELAANKDPQTIRLAPIRRCGRAMLALFRSQRTTAQLGGHDNGADGQRVTRT
jgi:hypothetical protein